MAANDELLALADELEGVSLKDDCESCLASGTSLCRGDLECAESAHKACAKRLREIVEHDAGEVTTVSAYDLLPENDRKAIAWVREHGGLDAVVELSSRLMTVDALRAAIEETCTRIGVEHTGDLTQDAQAIWREIGALRSRLKESVPRAAYERHLARRQRQIDESHAALRRRNARIGFLVSELNRAHNENHEEFMRRAGDYTAFTDEVCKRLAPELRYVEGCSKDVMDAALDALDRRLMPEGMEWLIESWPRFDDNEPLRWNDEYANGNGGVSPLHHVSLYADGRAMLGKGKTKVVLAPGERVKRQAPKVLDADGVEIRVGDTVYATQYYYVRCTVVGIDQIADEYLVEVENEIGHRFRQTPDVFTHSVPVLAADGEPLEAGQTVWEVGVETTTPMTVIDVDSDLTRCEYTWTNGKVYRPCLPPDQLTHQRPVLDADGVPIKVGDTVWDVEAGVEFEVSRVEGCSVTMSNGGYYSSAFHRYCPSKLTHAKPDLDTWERIEEDARLMPSEYTDRYRVGRIGFEAEDMRVDLVRRCRALAERGA